MSNIGVIDIGSNTFNLLVSSIKVKKTILSKETFVGIRKGTFHNIIQEKTIEKSILVLNKYKKICSNLKCKKIYVIATASLRNALNKHEFKKRCKKNTGLFINIVSGHEEAKLIFDGISNNITDLNNYMIVDIGGASTEFIIVKNKLHVYKKSYPFGSQLLIQKFNPSDPIKKKEIQSIELFFNKKLKDLTKLLKKEKVKNLMGSSGSFNCIFKIQSKKKKKSIYNFINTDKYQKFISPKILNSSITERKNIPGLLKMRAENIIITIILINFLLNEGIENIYTTEFSLKDGVFFNILNNTTTWQESLL